MKTFPKSFVKSGIMNETDLKLKEETEKWLNKIEKLKIEANSGKGKEMLKNMNAYVSDCKYFLEKKDFIKAFESVVWAWSVYELGKDLRIFDVTTIVE